MKLEDSKFVYPLSVVKIIKKFEGIFEIGT